LLSELGTAELFVLSSLRLWFLSHCDRDHEYPDWRQGFRAMGVSELGTWGFDRLCRVVGTTTVRSLDVHWLQCGRLGDYEVSLLKVIGLLQRHQRAAAEAELLEWCPPAAVRAAVEPARMLAVVLESHSLVFPVREHEPVPLRSSTVPAPAGSALLH
jgi:hypothetical protein